MQRYVPFSLFLLSACAQPPQVTLGSSTWSPENPAPAIAVTGVPNVHDEEVEDDLERITVENVETLRLSGSNQIRIYHAGNLVLSADQPVWSPFDDPVDLDIQFDAPLAQGLLVVEGKKESLELGLMSSPVLMPSHVQPAEELWVMDVPYPEYNYSNIEMVDVMKDVLGDRLTVVEPTYTEDGAPDVWIQDEFEPAYYVSDTRRIDVLIDSIRDRGLKPLPRDIIRDRDNTVRTVHGNPDLATTYDSFGNLEVSPPVPGYPAGRILYGRNGDAGPQKALRDFLAAQKLQTPLELDSTWLCVGHIDEYLSFLPDPTAPNGFRMLIADAREGFALLDTLDGNTPLPRYDLPYPFGHELGDVGDLRYDQGLRAFNEDVQDQHLTPLRNLLQAELGITDDEVITVPGVFEEVGQGRNVCGAVALIPGMVNMLVATGEDTTHAFIPDPFFRADEGAQQSDPFIQALNAKLPANVTPHYVDDWQVYHMAFGEVHCGTNTLRTPDKDWRAAAELLGAE